MPLPERQLIAAIRRLKQPRGKSSSVVKGIGDDCAVLRPPRGHELLVTTDFNLEGTHFRREWHPAETVGHRCLARGLSDIAAMGGEPLAAFLSLALPADLPQKWVDEFLRGLLRLARRFGVELAGGDVSTSPGGVLADIIVVGSVPRGKAILRSGARPGDRIYVTGALGGAAAVLERMFAGETGLKPGDYPRHFFPEPRIEVGRALCEKKLASAMIDVSDGLSVDLAHVCEESGVGAEIDAEAIPRAVGGKNSVPALRPLGYARGRLQAARDGAPDLRSGPSARLGGSESRPHTDLRFALHGGDDYELIFTAPPGKKVPRAIAGVAISEIGVMTRGKKVLIRAADGRSSELKPEGWQHFGK